MSQPDHFTMSLAPQFERMLRAEVARIGHGRETLHDPILQQRFLDDCVDTARELDCADAEKVWIELMRRLGGSQAIDRYTRCLR